MCKACGSNKAPLRSMDTVEVRSARSVEGKEEVTLQKLFESGKYKLVRFHGRNYTATVGSPTGVIVQDGLRSYGRGKEGDYLLVHEDDIAKTPQTFSVLAHGSTAYNEALQKFGLQEVTPMYQDLSIAAKRAVEKAVQDVEDAEQRAEDHEQAVEEGRVVDGVIQDGTVEGDVEMNLSKVESLRGENAPAEDEDEEKKDEPVRREAQQEEPSKEEMNDAGGKLLSKSQAIPLAQFRDDYGYTHHMQVMSKIRAGELKSYKDEDGETFVYHFDE